MFLRKFPAKQRKNLLSVLLSAASSSSQFVGENLYDTIFFFLQTYVVDTISYCYQYATLRTLNFPFLKFQPIIYLFAWVPNHIKTLDTVSFVIVKRRIIIKLKYSACIEIWILIKMINNYKQIKFNVENK